MFDQYLDQARRRLADELVQKRDMNEREASAAADATGRGFVDLVKAQLQAKDHTAVDEALSGQNTEATNAAVHNLVDPLTDHVRDRTGMDRNSAHGVVTTLLPVIFNMFNDPVREAQQKGIDLKALVKQVAGGGGMAALAGLGMGNMGAMMDVAKNMFKNKKGGPANPFDANPN